jgi:hypothetical protein
MSDTAAEFRAWVESLDDDRLLDFRFELYDRCEIAPEDSYTHEFARVALKLVGLIEERRALCRELWTLCLAMAPGAEGVAGSQNSPMTTTKAGTMTNFTPEDIGNINPPAAPSRDGAADAQAAPAATRHLAI